MTTTTRATTSLLASLLALAAAWVWAPPAGAEPVQHGALVQETPEWAPPNMLDGDVRAVTQVGNRVLVGGTFGRITDAGQSWDQAYLAAYDRFTGELDTDFLPQLNGRVRSIADAGDGNVVVVGDFTRVDGTWRSRVAKLRLSDGAVVGRWRANTDAFVTDVAVVGDQVWLTGRFTMVNGTTRGKVAIVDNDRGNLYPERADLTGNRAFEGGVAGRGLDVSPDGSTVALVHTAEQVDGRFRPTIATFATATRTLTSWGTRHYDAQCQPDFDLWPVPRDVKYSPSGDWFVVVTAIGNFNGTCDVAVRFPAQPTGEWMEPTWISRVFDTPEAVAVTDAAVYVGGHMNCGMAAGTTWTDYPDGNVHRCPAPAVPHQHLMALDHADGTALDWFPDVRSQRGVLALEAVDGGLLAGSDGYQWNGRVIGHHALYELGAPSDTTAPDTVLDTPAGDAVVAAPVTVTGSASDDRGVRDVLVAVRDTATGLWLQPDGTWGSWTRVPSAVDRAGATSTTWSVVRDLAPGRYLVDVRARDQADNVDTTPERVRFRVAPPDEAAPTSTITAPPEGANATSPVVLEGTADDDVGVAEVALYVRRSDGTWLQPDGSFGSWAVVAAVLSDPGAASTSWSLAADLPQGTYRAWVRTTDTSGRKQPSSERPDVRFTVFDADADEPVVAIATPAEGATPAAGTVTVSGDATDDVAVDQVVVEVRDRATGQWLRRDGTFGAWENHVATVAAPGTAATTWTLDVDLPPGSYVAYARAFDSSGSRSVRPSRRFDVG